MLPCGGSCSAKILSGFTKVFMRITYGLKPVSGVGQSIHMPAKKHLLLFLAILCVLANSAIAGSTEAETKRYLYVAAPGIRNYLEYGGHGILVFDIDQNHRFVKRIPSAGLETNGKPMNVKGVCASQSLK